MSWHRLLMSAFRSLFRSPLSERATVQRAPNGVLLLVLELHPYTHYPLLRPPDTATIPPFRHVTAHCASVPGPVVLTLSCAKPWSDEALNNTVAVKPTTPAPINPYTCDVTLETCALRHSNYRNNEGIWISAPVYTTSKTANNLSD